MNDFGRILVVYVVQLLFSAIFLFLAYRIIKRNRNRLTLNLSGLYISSGMGFILNAIYPSFRINPSVYVVYFTAAYLILFGPIFLIIFLLNLLKIDTYFSLKKQLIIMSLYAITLFFLLSLPGGITINEDTKWTPIFSWTFLVVIYIFITFFITLPISILSIKLYKSFKDNNLKKKLRYFYLGCFGLMLTLYGLVLYNTWTIFKLIWNIVLLFILIPSALLIYYAWAHRL